MPSADCCSILLCANLHVLVDNFSHSSEDLAHHNVTEHAYEWYADSMINDGRVWLGTMRKWRLHKEQTGHGAFYRHVGMCDAPNE
jgi:hypothetical protein